MNGSDFAVSRNIVSVSDCMQILSSVQDKEAVHGMAQLCTPSINLYPFVWQRVTIYLTGLHTHV